MAERPCIDCGEPTLNPERCRDCGIEHSLKRMECAACGRMKYQRRTAVPGLGELAASLWGEPCACPKPDKEAGYGE